MHMKKRGTFVISLDFELFWGMTDKTTLKEYGEHIRGVRTAIPRMLALFEKYDVHATWATVGMLSFESKEELLASFPVNKPVYTNARLSTYEYTKTAVIGENEDEDPYHFGTSLIEKIRNTQGQEIGSHTFSHYYCHEEGQTVETFREDLELSIRVLSKFQKPITALVLPRNQWNKDYLTICAKQGITAFRGNQQSFLYRARTEKAQTNLLVRAARLIDQYIPLSGANTHADEYIRSFTPYNVPASMFLRPYSRLLSFLEPLRIWRFKGAMTHAAKTGTLFHLWWHPHNFGVDTEKNLQTLEKLLIHAKKLEKQYGMQSATMSEVANRLS